MFLFWCLNSNALFLQTIRKESNLYFNVIQKLIILNDIDCEYIILFLLS